MLESLREALGSVRAHWIRFALTGLGVAWGGFMLTFLSALLGGMNDHFRNELEEVGPKMVYMGGGVVLKNRIGERASREVELEVEDVLRLGAITSVEEVSPNIELYSEPVRGNKRTKLLAVAGWDANGLGMRNFELDTGRGFSPLEVERAARVAVIGPEAAERLFGTVRVLGETIRIGGHRFRVIGTTVAKGDQMINTNSRDDLLVMVPYTTALRHLVHDDVVPEWMLTPPRPEDGARAIVRAREVIARHEGFAPTNDSALYAVDFWDSFKVVYGMFFAIQFFYVIAGMITLFVGATGVMNIMLVVVGERTPEIGLRKAIGARGRDIFALFLAEAVVVAVSAGMVGVAAGWLLVRALAGPMRQSGIQMPDTPDAMTSAAVVVALVLVAVVSGVVPAVRAGRVPPSEALRAY